MQTEQIQVRGIVQGVGFRPTVWRLAQHFKIKGVVYNDGTGVSIIAQAEPAQLDAFIQALYQQVPPLARIAELERVTIEAEQYKDFQIQTSQHSTVHTHIAPDAASCADCIADTFDVSSRRYHYPFTNCTHCGPRLTIVTGIPYDRAQTTMQSFPLCAGCEAEYHNPADRRFHAQPNACPVCGPQVFLQIGTEQIKGYAALEACASYLKQGKIVVIKGLGGMHLAVDATQPAALERLRQGKQRPAKPLALMAKNLAQVEQFCWVNTAEKSALECSAAPIVLLARKPSCTLSTLLAPQQQLLGFMLPYTPLHHLLMDLMDAPIVLSSGNHRGDPQCIDNEQSLQQLSSLADAQLLHNREIANRVDDSVLRYMAGELRLIRRARGFSPAPVSLAADFAQAPKVLALGAELKNTFCLLEAGQAIVSQHNGDLANFASLEDCKKHLALYQNLYQYQPEVVVIDQHPNYHVSQWGRAWAHERNLPIIEVQHHHAHIAACLAENHYPLNAEAVLGIVLDGSGYGTDHTLWGGELLKADYRQFERLAYLKPVSLLGGTQAILQPWRMAFAHLWASDLWEEAQSAYSHLDIMQFLNKQPISTLVAMQERGINSPLSSSVGRLFDAIAAVLGVCREQVSYEGQAAMELEALVDMALITQAKFMGYPFAVTNRQLNPAPMWSALLTDLAQGCDKAWIATRFHQGLASSLVELARQLAYSHALSTIALSGGVLQNRVLLEALYQGLVADFTVLMHQHVPANDGGLALGQAAIGAAQYQGAK